MGCQARLALQLTAPTGGAKTAIALAKAFDLASEGKLVVYLAGENADDVRARVILMQAKLGLERLPPTLRFVDKTFDLHEGLDHVRKEVEAMGGADLIFVDTSPAFQSASGGEEENSNNEQILWARHLRKLTKLPGQPAVIVQCHPTKYAQSAADCLPRGGGAFLAEVDGNYSVWSTNDDGDARYFELSWAGKFRGRFEPITYKTEVASCAQLRDEDGDPVNSVWGCRVKEPEIARAGQNQTEDEDAVLTVMRNYPNKSLSDWASILDWRIPSGPAKYRVERVVKRLTQDKFAKKERGH